MNLIFTEEALKYRSAGHPESPERVKTAYDFLQGKYPEIAPAEATEDDLQLVHDPGFVNRVKEGEFKNPDCPHYDRLFHFGLLSAGGAITAQQEEGFSLMRPPGHHAGRDFLGGFCYFNNLAVAVKRSGLDTLIVDIDGHHGNGTQDIFYGDKNTTYISLHRSYAFPGTGKRSRKNALNYPLEPNCGDEKYLTTLEKALNRADPSQFQQIAVSAGFDSHKDDLMASLGLTTGAFYDVGELLSEASLPIFAVLEGGYIGEDMGRNIHAFLQGLS